MSDIEKSRASSSSRWGQEVIDEYAALRAAQPAGTQIPRSVTAEFRRTHGLAGSDWAKFQSAVANGRRPTEGRTDLIRRREQSVFILALLGKSFDEIVRDLSDDADFSTSNSFTSLRATVFAIVARLGLTEQERIRLGIMQPPAQKLEWRRSQVGVGKTLGLAEGTIARFLGVSKTTINNDVQWLEKRRTSGDEEGHDGFVAENT